MTFKDRHAVLGTSMTEFPEGSEKAVFGMGCFWGVERLFWQQQGVITTACGYSGGRRAEPTYEQVCSGATGHAEVVLVVFSAEQIQYSDLLRLFWENHNPTQGMRQANDIGSQYRSVIYCFDDEQLLLANASRDVYQRQLSSVDDLAITTEIEPAPPFYYAEQFHQQYLHKNPGGYCNMQSVVKTGLPRLENV